jgi:monoamine oxidase
LLNLLFLVRAHGSINNLFAIEKGSQENLVDGGAGSMAKKMAADLGDAIRLSSPVRLITHRNDRVLVDTGDLEVTARRVVVAVPPALILDIAFDPVLPDDRRALYRAAVAGPETKTLVVYDAPFWREEGFSGQTADPHSASEITIDASPADASRGVLASFAFGSVAANLDQLDPGERRQFVVEALTNRFGEKAANPVDFVETAWWNEKWTRGCSMAHFPPNILTRYGPLLREPLGRIHWAGTETSTMSHGAIDGAIRSGERAANEVLSA